MKATVSSFAALLVLGATASLAEANPYFPPPLPRQAPDTCNTPPFYVSNPCGAVYGPNWWLRPPWQPFNGIMPTPSQQNQPTGFPTHPYARGPRDYFMLEP